MKQKIRKFRKGVASFYIVAFSTLILVVLATSFATVILSETTRTSNDDLSQSAYDSALAGVEDAKLAFSNYRRCIEAGEVAKAPDGNGVVTCAEIIYWMEHPDCDMVAHILGRIRENESGEVMVADTVAASGGSVTSNMNQAYTCVIIKSILDGYRANLSTSTPIRVIKANFANGVTAADIKSVRLNWYANRKDVAFYYGNILQDGSDWRPVFQPALINKTVTPPTIELQMIQTAKKFRISDFDITVNGKTDRATMFMVPINRTDVAQVKNDFMTGLWNGKSNDMTKEQVAKTNDRMVSNKPYGVYCPANSDNDFMCTVTIDLPEPMSDNGVCSNADGSCARNDDTFMFALSLPYGQPDTDFALEFLCNDGVACVTMVNEAAGVTSHVAETKDTQILIDSTGRANDLYRRIETRLETADTSFPYPTYALELLSNNGSSVQTILKDMTVTTEYNFYK